MENEKWIMEIFNFPLSTFHYSLLFCLHFLLQRQVVGLLAFSCEYSDCRRKVRLRIRYIKARVDFLLLGRQECRLRVGNIKRSTRARLIAELRGAHAVAQSFCGRADAAFPALLDGEFGLIVAPKPDRVLLVLRVTITDDGRISALEAVADRAARGAMDLGRLGD